MDPLSISASIAGLLALSGQVLQYLAAVNDAIDVRQRLLLEVSSTSGLLCCLKDLCDRPDLSSECFISLKSLNSPQGPLSQFKKALELLSEKLAPAKGSQKVKRVLTWFFDQTEVKALLEAIQRQKSYYMLALQGNHLLLSETLGRDIKNISTQIDEVRDNLNDLMSEQKRQGRHQDQELDTAVLTWICPTTFSDRLSSILARAQPGTGRWLFHHDHFLQWLEHPATTSHLWLPGIPGSGKTTLAAILIEHLQKTFLSSDICVVYIFCDYKDPSQTSAKLKRSILRQLLQDAHQFPAEIYNLYQTHGRTTTDPTLSEIDDAIKSAAQCFSRVFLVIDALDEVSESTGLIESLLNLRANFGITTSFLATSRWTGELYYHIMETPYIEVLAADQDITAYLQEELKSSKRLQGFIRKEPAFQDQLIDTVLSRCKGIFLVARLHIESLNTKPHLRAAKNALQDLSTSIDGVYDEAVDRLKRQTQDDVALAWRVFHWTVETFAPLTVDQLQHALAVDTSINELDEETLIDIELILSVCAGLIVLDRHSSTIRLVHLTAQEYFNRHRQEFFPNADHELVEVCIHYLSFPEIVSFSTSDSDLGKKLEDYPLLKYAAVHWGSHFARLSLAKEELNDRVLTFLEDDAKVGAAVQTMLLPAILHFGYSQSAPQDAYGLHLAVHFGLETLVERLLEHQSHNIRDSQGRTPLHWAAQRGKPAVTKILLDHGADVNAQDKVNGSSMHLACRYGHVDVMSTLIDYSCDLKASNNVGGTALIWAAIGRSEEAIKLLLQHGPDIDVNASTKSGRNALHHAVSGDELTIVQLLLEHGAEVDTPNTQYMESALAIATLKGNEEMMRCLLTAGAMPDLRISTIYHSGETALHLAARSSTDGPGRLLLEFGSDPDRRDAIGNTPLHIAAERGNLVVVSFLVSVSRLDIVNNKGQTALHAAVNAFDEQCDGEVITCLLQTKRISFEALDNNGLSALSYAQQSNLPTIAKLLSDAIDNEAHTNNTA